MTAFGGGDALFAVLAFALVFYGLGNFASVTKGAWFPEKKVVGEVGLEPTKA